MSNDLGTNPLEDTETEAARAYAKERRENIRTFVRTSPDYYIANFDKIGASARFTATFNFFAGLFGPIWYGARGLWSWALPFLIIEALGFVQIARGLFGDLAADAMARIASIEGTLELRRKQLAAATESGSDKQEAYQRAVDGLEASIDGFRAEAQALSEQGLSIALTGVAILIVAKIAQAVVANWALEARFTEWTSDRSIRSGMPVAHIVFAAIFMAAIVLTAMAHYSFPGRFALLSDFPTDPDIRLTGIDWVENFIAWCVLNSEVFFDGLTFGIRALLDALEVILVQTPWIVIASLIVLLTWLTAGVRTAIYSGAFLAYMGLLGFWEAAMTTLALLGTAACLSIAIGIPLGNVCRPPPSFLRVYPADHGFHANHARVRFYGACDRILWCWQTCGRCCDDDFWRHASSSFDGPRPARRTGKRARGGDQLRCKQVVLADKGRFAIGQPVHQGRHQSDHHVVLGDGRGCLADRGQGAGRRRTGSTAIRQCWARHSCWVFDPVLRHDP